MAVNPQQYIDAIQAFLLTNIAVKTMTHPSGMSITIDRKSAYEELTYWQNQLRLQSSNPYKISTRRLKLQGDA
jgi:hypothetical protein